MYIKDEILDSILTTPEHFAAIFLLVNNKGVVETTAFALQMQLERKYKVAKQSIVIADYFRSKGYKDSEIFEN
ncbi:hypothetical protein [Chryseobacterium sp. YIM B08800]|uniref:hypothetical protein n=1 Tax=Chryseobacterium sp. YIM B08800 TaxID=2984136 RepID=UPI00223F651D|nr:hypothetical protein [Chryseobacterium sp. YIM B08800]